MASLSTFELYKHLGSGGAELSDEQVHDIQAVVWEMAQKVIALCDKEGIPYILDGGSCLGAIRHAGFIPWDDDMDISILRKDYDRFLHIVERDLGDDFWIHAPDFTHDYGLPMIQLRLKGTTLRGKDDFAGNEFGIPLDIFVIENMFDNSLLRAVHGLACNCVGFLQVCKKTSDFYEHFKTITAASPEARKSVNFRKAIGKTLFWTSLDRVTHFTIKVYSLCKNDKSKYVSFPSGRKHFFGEMHEREVLMPPSEAVFEDAVVSVPNDPHRYLEELFGPDYLLVPEENDRERHVVLEFSM